MTIDISAQPDYVRALLSNTNGSGSYVGARSWSASAGTSATITYSFDSTKMNAQSPAGTDLTQTQQDAIVAALQLWSDVAGVTFQEDNSAPNIVFASTSVLVAGRFAQTNAYLSGGNVQLLTHADVTLASDRLDGYNVGDDGFRAIIHEIGHALGLSHPWNNAAAGGFTDDATTMSDVAGAYATGYDSYDAGTYGVHNQGSFAATPMADDIAAAQFLYSAATTAGNVVHYLDGSVSGVQTLWDSTGTDSIQVSGSGAASIDLQAGAGHHSAQGSDVFFIAYGANIDKAVGGSGADTIVGNAHANDLSGAGGNDTITPGAGNDTIATGSGADTIVFDFNGAETDHITDFTLASDVLDFSRLGLFSYDLQANATESGGNTTLHINGMDIEVQGITKTDLFNPTNAAFSGLIGGTAGNNLVGNSSANTMDTTHADINGHYATSNNDTLTGNAGNDSMNGGSGNDTYVWNNDGQDWITDSESDTNILKINMNAGDVVMYATPSYGWMAIYTYSGTTLTGYVAINGEASISGGYEIDYLQFNDHTYDVTQGLWFRAANVATGLYALNNSGNDTMDGGSAADSIYGYGGNDSITAGAGADYVEAGTGADSVVGGADADTIYGQDGNDTIDGGAGNDALFGGNGDDTYIWKEGEGDDYLNSENESDNNTLRLVGVTSDELFMTAHSWWYPNQMVIAVFSGGTTYAGTMTIYGENSITSGYEIDQIQLDDVTYTAANGMLWRGTSVSSGESIYTLDNSGADTVLAGAGNDSIYAYGGDDTIDAGTGADYVEAGTGNDTVTGGADNDSIYGQDGNDVLEGGADNDTLFGQAGDDTLTGGAGNDNMYGDTGNDTYIIGTTDGHDGIYDYSGSNVLDIGTYDHYTDTDSGHDRTYYFDGTGTHWVFIDDFNIHTWSVI